MYLTHQCRGSARKLDKIVALLTIGDVPFEPRESVSHVLSRLVAVGAFGLVSAVSTYALSRVVRFGSSRAYRERVRR